VSVQAPPWLAASVLFFGYVIAVALVTRGLDARRRRLAAAGGAAGLIACVAAGLLPSRPIAQDLLVPPALLLLGYWASGLLFTNPMPRVERTFAAIDDRLRIDARAAAAPRWVAEVLEAAYTGVYPAVALALAVHTRFTPAPDAGRFWTVVLVTDFVCFGFLPWIRTRPPRAFLAAPPWRSRVRRFNLRLLGAASIQVNTCPSGHAAEAVAAAMLVAAAPWPFAAGMAAVAVLVSAGAVFGRYHYAVDAAAGAAVAILVNALV
jgi:hypothetical protein